MIRRRVDSITVEGLTSMESVEVRLGDVNILVGANGAGKSNFIAGLELLGRLLDRELGLYVGMVGGASALLHGGPKRTRHIRLQLQSGAEWYEAELVRASGDVFVFGGERLCLLEHPSTGTGEVGGIDFGSGGRESYVAEEFVDDDPPLIYKEDPSLSPDPPVYDASAMLSLLYGVRVFHFHDTSRSAPVKQFGSAADNEELHPDAGNLAAFLKRIKDDNPATYRRIVRHVQQVAPFLRDFVLRPENNDQIRLRWRQEGTDQTFPADALSDGTLRYICLTTLLNQPNPPGLIVIDEPELGLHPFAIVQLADMLRSVGTNGQVLVATQSVTLVNQFSVDDVIVAQRVEGASEFIRPNAEALSVWLDDYALGDLWEKNLLGGRPVKEGGN